MQVRTIDGRRDRETVLASLMERRQAFAGLNVVESVQKILAGGVERVGFGVCNLLLPNTQCIGCRLLRRQQWLFTGFAYLWHVLGFLFLLG